VSWYIGIFIKGKKTHSIQNNTKFMSKLLRLSKEIDEFERKNSVSKEVCSPQLALSAVQNSTDPLIAGKIDKEVAVP
jgi:hypothetical protein